MPKKILYNATYGGFCFSSEFVEEFARRHPASKDKAEYGFLHKHRTDPHLIALVEEFGWKTSSAPNSLIAIDIVPDDMEWEISEYDGLETIKWTLPKNRMLDDLAKIIRGEIKLEDAHVITRAFMVSGKSAEEFKDSITK